MPPRDDAVDLSVLLEIADLVGTDGDVTVCELITLFLENSLSLLQQLRDAIATDDSETACQVAHTLRSPAGQLGAQRLAHLCERLESLYSSDKASDGEALFYQILSEYERVRYALRQLSIKFCHEIKGSSVKSVKTDDVTAGQ